MGKEDYRKKRLNLWNDKVQVYINKIYALKGKTV
jgi:hypothetical protein